MLWVVQFLGLADLHTYPVLPAFQGGTQIANLNKASSVTWLQGFFCEPHSNYEGHASGLYYFISPTMLLEPLEISSIPYTYT